MEEIKQLKRLSEGMLNKELVDILNNNFSKLDEEAKEHRNYVKIELNSLSMSLKNLKNELNGVKNDVADLKTSIDQQSSDIREILKRIENK